MPILAFISLEIVEYLIDQGYKLKDVKNPHALNRAVRNSDLEIVKFVHEKLPHLYKEREKSINYKIVGVSDSQKPKIEEESTGYSALCFALGNLQVTKYLLDDLKFPIESVLPETSIPTVLVYACSSHLTSRKILTF